jgi:hypothetical protein
MSAIVVDDVTDASVAQMSGNSVLYVAIRTAGSNGRVGFLCLIMGTARTVFRPGSSVMGCGRRCVRLLRF